MAVLKPARELVARVALLAAAVSGSLLAPGVAHAARIKDIADIQGVRPNQLVGYGVVTGLNGTGDGQQAVFTIQSILSMLRRRGINITVDPRQLRVENAAAVVVTATLPPFARVGSRIDVQVSSIGDAESLQGGTLVLTPLFAPDQQVYAVAQGPVSLGGGFSAQAAGAAATKSHPTVGYISDGAIVEREVPVELAVSGTVRIALHEADFTTVARVAEAVNLFLGGRRARAVDARTVDIRVEPGEDPIALLNHVELLEVSADRRARVVLNERTGTVIMGENVRIAPVAIAHGSLSIQVKTDFGVSQPAPLSEGETVVVPDTTLSVQEGKKESLMLVQPGVGLGELVAALNALGVTPQDLIAVLQAMKAAGALEAELEIM